MLQRIRYGVCGERVKRVPWNEQKWVHRDESDRYRLEAPSVSNGAARNEEKWVRLDKEHRLRPPARLKKRIEQKWVHSKNSGGGDEIQFGSNLGWLREEKV